MKVSTRIGIGTALAGLVVGIGVAIKKHKENEFKVLDDDLNNEIAGDKDIEDEEDIDDDELLDNDDISIDDEDDDDSANYETHTVSGRSLDFCKGIIEERHGKDYEILNVNETATDKNSAFPDEEFTRVVYSVLKCA